jgi:precorrin-4 methylase
MTLVRCLRGGVVESEHRVAWCVVDGDDVVEAWPGAADLVTFARSAVKPWQALSSVRAGVLERFGLGERHLAVACASHGGSDAHVALVAEMLAAGFAAATPACVVQEGTRPGERAVYAPLGCLAQCVENAGLAAPALIVVGIVVNQAAAHFQGVHNPHVRGNH